MSRQVVPSKVTLASINDIILRELVNVLFRCVVLNLIFIMRLSVGKRRLVTVESLIVVMWFVSSLTCIHASLIVFPLKFPKVML